MKEVVKDGSAWDWRVVATATVLVVMGQPGSGGQCQRASNGCNNMGPNAGRVHETLEDLRHLQIILM